jgi:hypothetical protein
MDRRNPSVNYNIIFRLYVRALNAFLKEGAFPIIPRYTESNTLSKTHNPEFHSPKLPGPSSTHFEFPSNQQFKSLISGANFINYFLIISYCFMKGVQIIMTVNIQDNSIRLRELLRWCRSRRWSSLLLTGCKLELSSLDQLNSL